MYAVSWGGHTHLCLPCQMLRACLAQLLVGSEAHLSKFHLRQSDHTPLGKADKQVETSEVARNNHPIITL